MSEKSMTGKDAAKRIAPVALALILVVIIAIVVTSAKGCSNKTPKIDKSDDVYLTLGDMKVTNDRLYTYMKQSYGVDELLRLVDSKIYEEKVNEVSVKSTSLDELSGLDKYIMESVFKKVLTSTDEEGVKKANQEKWDDLINSLLMNNLMKSVDEAAKDAYKLDSSVWTVVRKYYALQYARREAAKEAYKAELKASREKDGKDGYFDEDKFKKYYEENYSDNVIGLFIPFTSEEAALKAMSSVGINTNRVVLGKDGWVKASYDYNNSNDTTIPASEFLSSTEVFDKFFELYNLVYKYLGKQISSDDYTETISKEKTLSKINAAIKSVLEDHKTVKGNVVLPLEVKLNGLSDVATITWSVAENSNLVLAEDGKTLVYTSPVGKDGKDAKNVKVTVTATVKYNDLDESKSTFEFTVEPSTEPDEVTTLTVGDVDPFYTYSFTKEKLDELEEKGVKLVWSTKELSDINSSLSSILKVDSTTYPLSDDASKFYKTYTIKPQKCGDYYVLAIKWGKQVINDYNDADIKAEIEEKLLEAELTDNNISKMIYQKRQEANLQIFDRYLEAIYDYRYTYFYETTLKLTDYDKYVDSKKKESTVVARFTVNKKDVEITAETLFEELKDKYAVSTTVDLINQYRIISSKFNTIYNSYTNDVKDSKTFRDLLENEIGGFRKNFELNYFTYSYLSYYGFTPNFPAKYGWNNFKHDYFGSYSDEELLTNANFGGSIYTKALTDYTESLYTTAGEGTWEETDVYKKMKEAQEKWYGLKVVNLMVYVDNDFDSEVDTQSDKHTIDDDNYEFETSTWTDEQRALVDELLTKVLELADSTDKSGIYNQINEIVTNYKNAGFEEPLSAPTELDTIYTYNYWAKFKKAGLMLKVESAQDYSNTSSLAEEFLSELETMYKDIKEAGYEGTFDVPYISKNTTETTYGYHKIIALGVTDISKLPSEEDVLIYNLVQKASNNVNATVTYKKEIYNEAVKTLKDKYDIEYKSGYTLDTNIKSRIDTWYTNAVTELSGSDVLSAKFIEYLKDNKGSIVVSGDSAEFNRILDIIIKVSEEDLNK